MLIDISCNITDHQFKDDEIESIIQRCRDSSVLPIFVGLDYESSKKSLRLAEMYNTLSYIGIHPLHAKTQQLNIADLLCDNPHIGGIGECGLDYYRLEYCDKNTQKDVFRMQLDIQGPRYFLHCRNSYRDFLDILDDYSIKGVVHSFTGTIDESLECIKKGYYIGINGCSMKSDEGIELIKEIPVDRILIETDSPYCKIRKSYAGYKYIDSKFTDVKALKKRNEPCCARQVIEAISKIKDMDIQYLEEVLYENTNSFFDNKIEKIKF